METTLGTFKDKNGNTFTMPIREYNKVSVLEGGYLITTDGQFIPITDKDNHEEVINEYINKYECATSPKNYDTAKSISVSVNMGNIVYMGRKIGDNMNTISGAFIAVIPFEGPTEEQKTALEVLKKSNMGIFKREIVALSFIHLDDSTYEFDDQEEKSAESQHRI